MTVNEYRRPGEPAPRPIPPRVHDAAGRNFTDRGIEDHGVPIGPDSDPKDAPVLDYAAEEQFDFPAEGPQADPVPVFVVNNSPIEQRRFITYRVPVASDPVRLAPQDRRRERMLIKKVSAANVYFGPSSDVSTYNATFPDSGVFFELKTTDDVWVICSGSDTNTIDVMVETWTDLRTVEDKLK